MTAKYNDYTNQTQFTVIITLLFFAIGMFGFGILVGAEVGTCNAAIGIPF